jgi:hypothetical protein
MLRFYRIRLMARAAQRLAECSRFDFVADDVSEHDGQWPAAMRGRSPRLNSGLMTYLAVHLDNRHGVRLWQARRLINVCFAGESRSDAGVSSRLSLTRRRHRCPIDTPIPDRKLTGNHGRSGRSLWPRRVSNGGWLLSSLLGETGYKPNQLNR